jgi:histidine ammonia-lyase
LTVLAAVASQAFHVTGRAAPPELAEMLDAVRTEFPPVTVAQTVAEPLARLMARLRHRIYDVADSLGE